MALLQAGVDTAVIALWLGHADIRSTNVYLHADMTIKQRALELTTPPSAPPGRYRPVDPLLAFLEGLQLCRAPDASPARGAHHRKDRRPTRGCPVGIVPGSA